MIKLKQCQIKNNKLHISKLKKKEQLGKHKIDSTAPSLDCKH